MKYKYMLLSSCERDIDMPKLFFTIEDARAAMKKALIYKMEGLDETIFEEYELNEEYWFDPEEDSASFNHKYGNCDWQIVDFEEVLRLSGLDYKENSKFE